MQIRASLRSVALVLVFALTVPVVARADDASHRAKAKEFMTLLKTEHMVTQISDNIRKQVNEAGAHVVGPDASPERQAKLEEFKKQSYQDIDDQLGWKALESAFTDIYVKTFTEAELDSILAFYKSPAGMALLEKMPSINEQLTRYGQTRITALQPTLKQLYADFQKNAATTPPTLGPVPDKPATPASPTSHPK